MNKRLDVSLYKSLVESDFILLNHSSISQNSYISKQTALSETNKISALNVLQLVKSIKQLIRIFKFLSTQKQACLHVVVSNRQHFFLLKQYLLENPLRVQINLQNSLLVKKNGDSTQMLLSFEEEYSTNSLRILKRLLSENIFITQKVNSKLEANTGGSYKIYNDTFDFKKIIFLIILLEQTLSPLNT